MTSEAFVGIDVSKRWLEVGVHGENGSWTIGNDPDGYATLLEEMKALQPRLIVFEATGGYESRAVKVLSEAQFAVAVANPTRVRRFAEALGILAKTDKIDAKVIAHFASVVQPAANSRQTPLEEQLAAFVERRRQLLVEVVAEKNRLSTCPACVREGIEEHIAWIEARVDELEAKIQSCILQKPEWQERAEIIDSVPGVGSVTATRKLPPWRVWHPSTRTAVQRKGNAGSSAVGLECGERYSWLHYQRRDTIRLFGHSTSLCSTAVRRKRSLWLLACVSYWSLSTPWLKRANPGGPLQLELITLTLTFITVAPRSALRDEESLQ